MMHKHPPTHSLTHLHPTSNIPAGTHLDLISAETNLQDICQIWRQRQRPAKIGSAHLQVLNGIGDLPDIAQELQKN